MNFNAVYNFLPANQHIFFRRMGTVRACCNNNGNIFIRNAACINFINNNRQKIGSTHKASNIAYNNGNLIAFLHNVFQRSAFNRTAQRIKRSLFNITGNGRLIAMNVIQYMFFRQHYLLVAAAIRESVFLHCSFSFFNSSYIIILYTSAYKNERQRANCFNERLFYNFSCTFCNRYAIIF